MNRPLLRLTLDIDPSAEPIAGTLRAGDGPDQPFVGWTQLGQGVESAIRAVRPGSGDPERAADGGNG